MTKPDMPRVPKGPRRVEGCSPRKLCKKGRCELVLVTLGISEDNDRVRKLVSSLGQNVVNVFFFPFWRDEGRQFLRSLPEHRVESGVII